MKETCQESAIGGCLTHFQALRSQLGGNIRVARVPANGVQDFTLSISAHSIPTQFQQMHRGQTAKSGCMGKPVFPCQIHASIINNTLRQATGMPNAMARARIMGHAGHALQTSTLDDRLPVAMQRWCLVFMDVYGTYVQPNKDVASCCCV